MIRWRSRQAPRLPLRRRERLAPCQRRRFLRHHERRHRAQWYRRPQFQLRRPLRLSFKPTQRKRCRPCN